LYRRAPLDIAALLIWTAISLANLIPALAGLLFARSAGAIREASSV